jgi:beta-lactamase regulating signal transducer with metallopeptidase domain
MTSFSDSVIGQAWTQSWQVLVVAIVAAALTWAVGKRHAHLSYLLWMLVLVKSLTPPVFVSPTSVFSWSGELRQTVFVPAAWEPPQDAAASVPITRAASTTTAAIVSGESTPPSVLWTTVLAVFWSCGALLALGFRGVAHARFRRRLARVSTEPDERISEQVAAVSQRVGLSRSPRILITSLPIGPAVFGIWRPIVVLPESSLEDDRSANLEAVLAHELIHVRRRDPLHALLQLAAVSLWWWNPVVWFASRFATRERERCCDEEVLGTLGYSGEFYAQCMLDTLRAQVQPAVAAAPLTLTALPLTRRRLETILRRPRRFRSRAPRWLWVAAVVLGLALLPGGEAAERLTPIPDLDGDEPRSTDLNPPATTPDLLYLAWQEDDARGAGKPIPHAIWDLRGKTLSKERSDQLLEQKLFSSFPRRDGELRPLLMVFDVDRRITCSPVMLAMITADGKRHWISSSRGSPVNGRILSTAHPAAKLLGKWPQKISLEIKYPIDNVTVVKTLTEIPNNPVEIVPGVRWYLDPMRASDVDERTGKLQRAPNKTAGVLEIRDDARKLVSYEMRLYLRGEQKKGTFYGTFLERRGELYEIRVTEAFDNKDQIERLEIIRQRNEISRIDNVPLRLDLLPEKK